MATLSIFSDDMVLYDKRKKLLGVVTLVSLNRLKGTIAWQNITAEVLDLATSPKRRLLDLKVVRLKDFPLRLYIDQIPIPVRIRKDELTVDNDHVRFTRYFDTVAMIVLTKEYLKQYIATFLPITVAPEYNQAYVKAVSTLSETKDALDISVTLDRNNPAIYRIRISFIFSRYLEKSTPL